MNNNSIKEEIENIRRDLVLKYSHYLDLLMKLIDEELNTLKTEVKFGNRRYVAEIVNKPGLATEDPRIKSVNSIIDKITRSEGRYTLQNFSTQMPDIFRLRITCNYLSDVEKVVEKLKNSKEISNKFHLEEHEDKIYQSRIKEPQKAQWLRLHSLVFKHKNENECPKIEVQIMTMLFEAWDRKDHYLFYQINRMKYKNELTKPKIKMNAMSELLYVADEFFDEIQNEVFKESFTEEENKK